MEIRKTNKVPQKIKIIYIFRFIRPFSGENERQIEHKSSLVFSLGRSSVITHPTLYLFGENVP